ncbi:MAG: hypothetical protein IPO95_13345 [Rhodanobacteraceae bacterium]|nr:hypothetical protein [Rhodanobacteraceae bacterium]
MSALLVTVAFWSIASCLNYRQRFSVAPLPLWVACGACEGLAHRLGKSIGWWCG